MPQANHISADSELVPSRLYTRPNMVHKDLEAEQQDCMLQPQTQRFSRKPYKPPTPVFLPQVRLMSPAEAIQQEINTHIFTE